VSEQPVVIVDPHFRRMAEIFERGDQLRLSTVAQVVWGRDEPMPPEELLAALPQAVAIVTAGWRYGDILDRAPNLRAIIDVGGAFVPSLDYEECYRRHIRVLTAAPAFARGVAEMALGMALAAAREIVAGDRAMREGVEQWQHAGNASTFSLYGKPAGFIGYGSIAQALRALLTPFECPIAVYDPWVSPGYLRSQGVGAVGLEDLLAGSQVVFVLASPTADNRAMLNRPLLEGIRPGAVLVLISRAHVVDFDALTELVLAGRFKAAMDVFPEEPLAAGHPIRKAPNAILSAHRAGSVREVMWALGEMVVDDLEAIVHGLPPRRLQAAQPELIARYTSR
jgi:phosphoglycerate dehydrogenase-like enzyme